MAEVDPRFDPVFQRGYDPATHGDTRSRRTGEPGAADEAAAPPATGSGMPEHAPTVVPRAEDATSDGANSEDIPRRRVPYRLVLLLASAAAMVAAGGLVWRRVTADPLETYYGSDPAVLFRLQLVDSLITPLLVAGLTGLVLWLALGAMHRRDHA